MQGDTDLCPYGLGNYSSRSVIIGRAVREAAVELRAKLALGGALLGAAAGPSSTPKADRRGRRAGPADGYGGSWTRSTATPSGRGRGRGAWPGGHPLLAHRQHLSPARDAGPVLTYPTWPNGTAACVVEVDPESGFRRVLRWALVEDAGPIVNPLLADANLHGAIAQGIGSALFERVAYDAAGQLLTATLMDYTIPTAVELPALAIGHQATPFPFTPLGAKGVGESGISSALGALASAVEDAFPELDLRLERLPLTPQRVWRALREAPPRTAHGRGRGGGQPGRAAGERRGSMSEGPALVTLGADRTGGRHGPPGPRRRRSDGRRRAPYHANPPGGFAGAAAGPSSWRSWRARSARSRLCPRPRGRVALARARAGPDDEEALTDSFMRAFVASGHHDRARYRRARPRSDVPPLQVGATWLASLPAPGPTSTGTGRAVAGAPDLRGCRPGESCRARPGRRGRGLRRAVRLDAAGHRRAAVADEGHRHGLKVGEPRRTSRDGP